MIEHVQLCGDQRHALVRAPQQPDGAGHSLGREQRRRLVDLEAREFQPQLGRLMDRLKEMLVAVHDIRGRFLQREEFLRAQVSLVVGRRGSWEDWLGTFVVHDEARVSQ